MEDEPNSGYDNDDTNSQHGSSDNKVNNIASTMTTIEMMKCSICKNYVPRFDIRYINDECLYFLFDENISFSGLTPRTILKTLPSTISVIFVAEILEMGISSGFT